MRLMRSRSLMVAASLATFLSCPAFAQSGGSISVSASRVATQSTLSPPTVLQHYRPACGNKILRGLMIGAGAGAAWGLVLSANLGEPGLVPSFAALLGTVGAAGAYRLCR